MWGDAAAPPQSTSENLPEYYKMMPGSKVINHVVFAHKWFCDFMTRPNMRIKVGRMPHDIRIWGRIVGVRSTKQFVRHLLTPTS